MIGCSRLDKFSVAENLRTLDAHPAAVFPVHGKAYSWVSLHGFHFWAVRLRQDKEDSANAVVFNRCAYGSVVADGAEHTHPVGGEEMLDPFFKFLAWQLFGRPGCFC